MAPTIPTACNNASLRQPLQYGNAEPVAMAPISGRTTKNSYPKVTMKKKKKCDHYL